MSGRTPSINHIGFLTPGNYPEDDPLAGLEKTLRLELPYEFQTEEYCQIIHDFVTLIAPVAVSLA